ncbi:MAG: ISAs1 family transposase, partial [Clostridiales bacterium]|nr:ISAs1 family transposase [Clostridiales bacterium]
VFRDPERNRHGFAYKGSCGEASGDGAEELCSAVSKSLSPISPDEVMAKAGGLGPGDLLTVVFNGLNKTLVIERGSQAAVKVGDDSVRLHLAAWAGAGDPAGIAALKSHNAGATVKIARASKGKDGSYSSLPGGYRCPRYAITHAAELVEGESQCLEAADGKVNRHSDREDRGTGGHGMLNVMHVYHSLFGGCVAQYKISEDKRSEITAGPELLKETPHHGAHVTVTADSLSCQIDTISSITALGDHYAIASKDNQERLHHEIMGTFDKKIRITNMGEDVELLSDDVKLITTFEEKSYTTYVHHYFFTPDLMGIKKAAVWKNLQMCGLEHVLKVDWDGKRTETFRTLITSHENANLAAYDFRFHWAVENLVHRTADVALKEDDCKTTEERGAYQLNSLRKVIVNILHAIGAALGVYDSEILERAGNLAPEVYFNNIFAVFNTEMIFKKLAGELELKPKKKKTFVDFMFKESFDITSKFIK